MACIVAESGPGDTRMSMQEPASWPSAQYHQHLAEGKPAAARSSL